MAKALLAVVESLDKVDESDRDYYVERDGKFFANVAPVGDVKLEDVGGLLSTLSKEKENAKNALAKLAEFDGMTAAQARKAIADMQSNPSKKTADDVQAQIEKATAALKDAAATKESELTATIESLTGQLDEVLIDTQVKSIMAPEKLADGSPNPLHGHAHLVLPAVHGRVKTQVNDKGKREAVVLDAAGNPKYIDGQGTTAGLDVLLGELKSDANYAPAFAGINAGGAGMPPNGGAGSGGQVVTRSAWEAMSPQARQDHHNAGGTVTD